MINYEHTGRIKHGVLGARIRFVEQIEEIYYGFRWRVAGLNLLAISHV